MSSRVGQKSEARERAAQIRAEHERAERRRRILVAGGIVALVLVVVAGLVVAKLSGAGSQDKTGTTTAPSSLASAQVVSALRSVPSTTSDRIGSGTAKNPPAAIKAPALTDGGKPKVLYVGAEYCPYCAAERWALVVALSRFGTFSHLGATHSASGDVFPDTPTLSFHGASYTSQYLSFTGVETTSNELQGNSYAPLDTLSGPDQKIFSTYNKPPYVPSGAGSIPFVDLGGTFVSSGASYSPQLLAGKSQEQVASALSDPNNDITKGVVGAANNFTAALCKLTGGQPGSVCSAPGVTQAATSLGQG